MRCAARDVERLASPADHGSFSASDVVGLPDAARALLQATVAPGTPRAAAACVRMRGSIKLNRWLPFRATEVLAPGRGFIWRARVAGLISGHDQCIDGVGEMQWRLAGLVTVAAGDGPDVSRSAAGREAGEAFWLPTTLLPAFGAEWRAGDDDRHVEVDVPTSVEPVTVGYELDDAGFVRAMSMPRWGDPDDTGRFGFHTFGGTMTEPRRFGDVTIPARGRVGWHFGEPGWDEGEFFRYEITDLQLLGHH
jgi:hypothetical protein